MLNFVLIALLAYVLLSRGGNSNVEGFHDRGTGGGRLFGCAATSGYKQAHPLFIQPGQYQCAGHLDGEWCYDRPQEWADPPPLDYRVSKDVCYC